jgi:uncharacterized protein YfiM (DUF2279 family)
MRGLTPVRTLASALLVGAGVALSAEPAAAQGRPAARAADPWFAADKVKHAALAFFVQSVVHSTLRATGGGHRSSLAVASAVTAVVGVGKEWHDRGTTGFSARDLAWDVAGAGAATLLLRRTAR